LLGDLQEGIVASTPDAAGPFSRRIVPVNQQGYRLPQIGINLQEFAQKRFDQNLFAPFAQMYAVTSH
jgi:hypothetical protein